MSGHSLSVTLLLLQWLHVTASSHTIISGLLSFFLDFTCVSELCVVPPPAAHTIAKDTVTKAVAVDERNRAR